MIIAVPYDYDGTVFQHFGKTALFKLYNIMNNKIEDEVVISTNGQGHGALAQVLSAYGTDILICGGIGPGAVNALAMAEIKTYPGVSGSADAAVTSFMKGELEYDPDASCDHHEHQCDHNEEHCCN